MTRKGTKGEPFHRLMVNLDVSLYEWLRTAAHTNRQSMSREINDAVAEHLKRKAKSPEIRKPARRVRGAVD